MQTSQFFSKILLFGEYGIIKSSKGLSIPYDSYSGFLSILDQGTSENKVSHNWSDNCGISNMKLYSEESWINFFKIAGFNSIKSWRFGAKKDWAGTLIVRGVK